MQLEELLNSFQPYIWWYLIFLLLIALVRWWVSTMIKHQLRDNYITHEQAQQHRKNLSQSTWSLVFAATVAFCTALLFS